MKRLIAATTVGGLLFTPVALAQTPTRQHQRQYTQLYQSVQKKFGPRAPGRQILKWGLASGKKASDGDLVKSISVLNRMLAPPPVATFSSATASMSTTSTSGACGGDTPYSGGGQCWAIPWSVVKCESGGQNIPNAQGSGAKGYYQLMSGGTGSRASQDATAAALWNGGAGASNWTCAG